MISHTVYTNELVCISESLANLQIYNTAKLQDFVVKYFHYNYFCHFYFFCLDDDTEEAAGRDA